MTDASPRESLDDLFDRLDSRWRGGTSEDHESGLSIIRFGASGKNVFRKLDVIGERNRLLIAGNANASNLSITIRGNGHTIFIGGGGRLRGLTMRLNHDDSTIALGRGITTGSVTMVTGEGRNIVIGDRCLFSHGVWIRSSDMHAIYTIADGERLNPGADVEIGERVWVAQDAKIGKGAQIGSGSVIGGGAMVRGIIPSNCVAAGSPARVLKEGIRWENSALSPRAD